MSIKRFRIVLDGVVHEVEVEELNNSAPRAAAPLPQTAVSVPSPGRALPDEASSAGTVLAPLQGTVLDVQVSAEQAVKAGQTLVVIEAMKMENEIVAPRDGTVASVTVHKGDAVAAGDMLVAFH